MQTIDASRFVRTEFKSIEPRKLLTSSVDCLLGVTQQGKNALDKLGIVTIFDLATSETFAIANNIVDSSIGMPKSFARYDQLPGELVDNAEKSTALVDLPTKSPDVLRNITPTVGVELQKALDIKTIRDLALWPPYHAARTILSKVYGIESAPDGDPEMPTDLIPSNGVYPTERVHYEVLLFDQFVGERTGRSPIPVGSDGPLDISEILAGDQGFSRPAIGGVLTFTQSWYTGGVGLGNLIHGVALGPGESTKIAMIDWSRRTRAAATEAIVEGEELDSDLSRNRSINEITSAVANETQHGESAAQNFATSSQSGTSSGTAGLAVLDFINPGVQTSGTSSGTSTGFTAASSWSTSSGTRNITGSLAQDIVDRTHQASHSVRNRRASIVKEVSQEESEKISTRTLTNYNHMHALTIEYYEVVQLYRTVIELTKADRCIFVPMKIINFNDSRIRNRYRLTIAANGLRGDVRALAILEEPDHVAISAPLRVKPWLGTDLEELTTATGEAVGTPDSSALVLPKSLLSKSLSEPSGSANGFFNLIFGYYAKEALIDRIIITMVKGETFTFGDLVDSGAGQNRWNPQFRPKDVTLFQYGSGKTGRPFYDIARIDFVKKEDHKDYEGELLVNISFNGSFPAIPDTMGASLLATIKVSKDSQQFTAFNFVESIETDDLIRHLNDNALHYSQAIWRALDPATIGILLSGYTWAIGGQARPLIEVVDPNPLSNVANYLAFRISGDDERERNAWLSKKQIKIGTQREDQIPVPCGGVFAEAVLGRFNSAEKLDITRFWNWQDSPIPITTPEIATIQSGSRSQPDNTVPGQLGQPVLNIVNAPPMPDPQGMSAVMAAIQNGNMFRDMSGLAATIGLAQAGLAGTQQGASDASTQAGKNAEVAAQLGAKVAELAAKLISAYFTGGASLAAGGIGGSQGGIINSEKGISKVGSMLNYGRGMDSREAPPPKSVGTETLPPSGGAVEGNGDARTNVSSKSHEADAFDNSIGKPISSQNVVDLPPKSTPLDPLSNIPLDPGNGGRSIGPSALEVGDIILSTTKELPSKAIKYATKSPVSHSILYAGDGMVIEAIREGVVLRPIQEALADATLAVAFRYPGLTLEQALKIRDFAGNQLGKPYDYRYGVFGQALFRLDLATICAGKTGDELAECRQWVGRVNLGTGSNDKWFCSELVIASYAGGGVPLTSTPPSWSAPADIIQLSSSGLLGYVGHLKTQ